MMVLFPATDYVESDNFFLAIELTSRLKVSSFAPIESDTVQMHAYTELY